MTRTRASAKQAGSTFERQIADHLAKELEDDGIDRQVKTGSRDLGDIRGVKIRGQRIAIECKNTAKINLAGWIAEAEIERGNLDALAGVVIHKRHGKGKAADQWVTMTVRDFAALISGERTPE